MNIILLEDLENVGYADDLVDVKPGYARNFLIPRGKAVVANKENMAELEKRMEVRRKDEEKLAAEIQKVIAALDKAKIEIPAKVGTSGKLFGSVTTLQLADAIKQETGYEIDRRKITILDEIGVLGNYSAEIALPQDTTASFKFDVVEE